MMLSGLENYKLVDLTHNVAQEIPTWPGEAGFEFRIDSDFEEVGCRVMSYQCAAGIGTHMDAPLHFDPDGDDIASVLLENLVVPLMVMKVSADGNPDLFISKEDIRKYEAKWGLIPAKSFVAGDTGWSKHWQDATKYRNPDSKGKMHFPGFSLSAVELLLERGITGIGIDTLSPDGSNMDFPVHHLLLPRGKYMIENMANLDKVPERGAYLVALPPKIKGGAEAPCRAIALIPFGE